MIHFEWKNSQGLIQDRWFSHVAPKHKKASPRDMRYSLENIDKNNKTATLIIENKSFVSDFWISSDILGVRFSENFMNYLPGKHFIQIKYFSDSFSLNQLQFYWR